MLYQVMSSVVIVKCVSPDRCVDPSDLSLEVLSSAFIAGM